MALPLLLILGAVLLGTAGEVLLKSGIDGVGRLAFGNPGDIGRTVIRVLSSPRILIGFACYGLAAILWLMILSRLELSYAYPMLALTYVLVPLAAHVFLGETLSVGRWAGILIIVAGVLVVAYHQPDA